MEPIQALLAKLNESATTYKPMTPREYEQFKVDGLNATEGTRHLEDGYCCDICKNKGYVVKLIEDKPEDFRQVICDCKCVPIRNSILRMRRSGLKDIIKDYTFDKFEASEPWQQTLKTAAMGYAANPVGWFFVGGQSGAGKTHICTAISREFLLSGRSVKYMLWRDDVVRLKANVNDSEIYQKMIDEYKRVDVLYVDDLFKTGKSWNDMEQKPTGADINIAFEIFNFRYNNPASVTIISSELTEDELMDIDEAVGGRIYERSRAITIGRDRSRNYRVKGALTV